MGRLDREGPVTAGRLAALHHAEPQTSPVRSPACRGWIERGTDRRQVLIRLTEQGTGRHAVARGLVRSSRLSPTERKVLPLTGTLMSALATWHDIDAEDGR